MSTLEASLEALGNAMHTEDQQVRRKPKRRKAKAAKETAPRRAGLSSGRIPPVRSNHVVGGYDVDLRSLGADIQREVRSALDKAKGSVERGSPKRKAKKVAAPKAAKAPKRKKSKKAKKSGGPKFQTRAEFLARMEAGRKAAAAKRGGKKAKRKSGKKGKGKKGKKKSKK